MIQPCKPTLPNVWVKRQAWPRRGNRTTTQSCAPTVVAIDFETSGFATNAACAIGMARIEAGSVVAVYHSLLRPPSPRVRFTHVHGLTWAMLKDAPTFAEAWPGMSSFWEGASRFVAHNASFDRRILAGCCQYANIPVPLIPFLCTLKGSRQSLSLASHALDSVCRHYSIALEHHNAASDAHACAQIYMRLRELGCTDEVMMLAPPKSI